MISTDAAYWRLCKDYIKPGDKPLGVALAGGVALIVFAIRNR